MTESYEVASPIDPRTVPVRFSHLKYMAQSAEHYHCAVQGGGVRTHSLELGGAVDALVYGTADVVAYPGPVRRGKEFEAFCAEHEGAFVLTRSDLAKAQDIARALERNALAVSCRAGQRQQTITWRIRGRKCQGTPDAFDAESVNDLKTTRSSNPDQFRWDAKRYGYHAQLAWYRNGLLQSWTANPQVCRIVAVESKAPYTVTVFRLTDKSIELGERCWRLWWERLMVCEQSNSWPGYAQVEVPLDLDDGSEGFGLVINGEEFEVES